MNLKEFIDHKQYCPICDTQLITEFHSSRKQVIKIEEHRFVVFFALDGLKAGQKPYAMSYSFDLSDLSFQVEFYTKDRSSRFETAHDFLVNRFRELHKNLKQFQFVRKCSFCRKYRYSTDKFQLDLKTATFPDLTVWSEEFGLVHLLDKNEHRIFKLRNIHGEGSSTLIFCKGSPHDAEVEYTMPKWLPTTELKLPLIPFVSKEETTQRLNNLLIFT